MKERPILFSAPMVRAILDGRKTQTRRVIKPPRDHEMPCDPLDESDIAELLAVCPYGQPGDRLWVREAWGYRCGVGVNPTIEAVIEYQADGARRNCAVPSDQAGLPQPRKGMTHDELERWWKRSRPSIHMPRWACRLALEVTDVRVERLQEISREDEIAEGTPDGMFFDALWSAAYGDASWQSDPWVWVISFRRVESEARHAQV